MNHIELTNKLVDELRYQTKNSQIVRKFTPKQLSQIILGSVPTSVGHVAEEVCTILRAEGCPIKYFKE